ncbi:MAG: MotA/TolQ/ExbB proton channel family protein [Phycisphaeraceae bacterium]
MKRFNPHPRFRGLALLLALTMTTAPATAQDASADTDAQPTKQQKVERLNETAGGFKQRLVESEAELSALVEAIGQDKAPINAELRALEDELKRARQELDLVARQSANRALEEKRLDDEIAARQKSASFVANRLDEYIREFEAQLHIAELQRYEDELDAAKLAMENRDLASADRFGVQRAVIEASLGRLEQMQGGATYTGSAIDTRGVLGKPGAAVVGTFVQVGPVVVFSDQTGELQGVVQQKIGTLLPEVVPYANPDHAAAVKQLVEQGEGKLPFDATMGEAQLTEQIQEETLEDELLKGGPVMYPIIGLALVTALVGVYKLLAILLTPGVSRRRLGDLLRAVAERDHDGAQRVAKSIRGPVGKMLRAGSEHLGEPRELIEEVMYERVLTARLKVQRMLPLIAICAAAAPLLGLLGTVSGIINTFTMMQISGSDMKNVSGGISEALITTKYGLIVAIPALLLHVILSRMARGVVDRMEKAGVAFINQVMKTPPTEGDRLAEPSTPSPDDDTPPTEPDPQDAADNEQASDEQGGADDAADDTDGSDDADILPAEEREKEPALVESRASGRN